MKKNSIYVLVLIAAIGISAFFIFNTGSGIEVNAYQVLKIDMEKLVDMSGNIEAGEYEEIALISGSKVIKTHTLENQPVEKGQLLAELDSGDITYRLDKLKINEQQLRQELSELQKPSTVSAIQSIKNKLAKAELNCSSIDRRLKEMEETVEKSSKLYQAGAIAEDQYKGQISARDGLSEQLTQAKIELSNAENELSDYNNNRAIEIQSKKRQLAANEADIKSLEKQLADTYVKASVSGTLVEFPLKEGRNIEQDSVIKIYDMSKLNFKGLLNQEDAVLVAKGQSATVTLGGMDKAYAAEVLGVKRYARLDKSSTSLIPKVEVELELMNVDENLLVGYEADAAIIVSKAAAVLAVPREAIRVNAAGQSIVYKIKDGIVKSTIVATGTFDEKSIEIKTGIAEGDLIIINPPEVLADGDSISINLK